MHDVMNGLQGNAMLVNGAVNSYQKVSQSMVRLRLLNGSNASVYNLHLVMMKSFTKSQVMVDF